MNTGYGEGAKAGTVHGYFICGLKKAK